MPIAQYALNYLKEDILTMPVGKWKYSSACVLWELLKFSTLNEWRGLPRSRRTNYLELDQTDLYGFYAVCIAICIMHVESPNPHSLQCLSTLRAEPGFICIHIMCPMTLDYQSLSLVCLQQLRVCHCFHLWRRKDQPTMRKRKRGKLCVIWRVASAIQVRR